MDIFRIVVYVLWGAFLALLISIIAPLVVPTFIAGAVLAVIITSNQMLADALRAPTYRYFNGKPNLMVRLFMWAGYYWLPSALAMSVLSAIVPGLFVLKFGFMTAAAIIWIPGLTSLGEMVDLRWMTGNFPPKSPPNPPPQS